MKKLSMLFCTALFASGTALTFAGNRAEVIIPGDHSPKSFKMAPNVKEGDYLPNTIIFKVKPQYRQNCKVNSVDNILPIQDFLQSIGAQNVGKIYPHHEAPAQERNMLGQNLVDLSLIYSFKYSANMKLEQTINQMLALGYFEYVEPWYVPKIHLTPNDVNTNQYYLKGTGVLGTGSINAPNAWGVNTGSTSVVIGITDTGTEKNHPDLAANLFHWTADPVDGVDNDGDGYIDNYDGWDVGMNDNDVTWQGSNHGVMTSGDADAVTNNGVGVASPGYNCKFFMTKIADATGTLVASYTGIVYAADHGAKIISNSWGGTGGGSYGQSIVDYAAINKNCLVIASAGNNSVEDLTYPSSFNHVYRVAASTNTDARASFSSYGFDVDYTAPGNNIYATSSAGGYASASGTSMACPISAGAAAIVQSQFNYTNAFQIGEKLKQTCTPMTDAQYTAGKLGKGRIDMYKALTQAAKSIMVDPITVTDGNDNVFMPSETLNISGLFTNYLDASSSAAAATLSVVSGPGTVVNGNYTIGALNTLASINNNSAPFTATINANATVNADIKFKIHIVDGTFTGDTYFDVLVNVDYINITINDVFTSITSKGRVGYNLDGQAQGLGFQYQLPSPSDLLYEMSLMIGTSSTKVSDMFRGATVGDVDFGSVARVQKITPAVVSDFDAGGVFNDAPSTTTAPIAVQVNHHAYAWSTAPYRKFVIVKYMIKNTGASALSNLYAGLLADWDIPNADAGHDKAAYDATNKMGYAWNTVTSLYAGIKLLTNTAPAVHYAIDNVNPPPNGGVNVANTTGFVTADKFTVLSTNMATAGGTGTGDDVMDCVSSGPLTINAGDSVAVAFAIIAGDNLADLQTSACAAQNKYDNSCLVGVNDLENDNFWMFSFPNPATTSVNINYNVVGYDKAVLRVMNSLGEVVMTLDNIPAGKNNLTIDVSKLSSGNYFYQMKAGEAVMTKKLTIVK
jgi:subtilisin family serine protease